VKSQDDLTLPIRNVLCPGSDLRSPLGGWKAGPPQPTGTGVRPGAQTIASALAAHHTEGRSLIGPDQVPVSLCVSFTPVRCRSLAAADRPSAHVTDAGDQWRILVRNTRKRVRGQPLRGFKSHLHRSDMRRCDFTWPCSAQAGGYWSQFRAARWHDFGGGSSRSRPSPADRTTGRSSCWFLPLPGLCGR
jgi:hypothetical protein